MNSCVNVIALLKFLYIFPAKITPRGGDHRDTRGDPTHIVPSQVPGLDLELSPRLLGPPTALYTQKDPYHEPHYTENRVLTPNKYRHHGHTAEFGTQTGMKVGDDVDTDRDGVYRILICMLFPLTKKSFSVSISILKFSIPKYFFYIYSFYSDFKAVIFLLK